MKILVVINHYSARGDSPQTLPTIRAVFNECLHGIIYTDDPWYPAIPNRLLTAGEIDTIAVVGGDGTANRVINDFYTYQPAIGIIPAGHANDLARNYQIPTDTMDACKIILNRHIRSVNAFAINGRYHFTNGGMALPAEVVRTTDRWRLKWRRFSKILGGMLYLLGFLKVLTAFNGDIDHIRIKIDNHLISPKVFSLVIGLNPVLGSHFKVFPGKSKNDKLGLYIINKCRHTIHSVITAVKTVFGKQSSMPEAQYFYGERIEIMCEKPFTYFADGELMPPENKLDCRLIKNAIRLIIPKNGDLSHDC